MNKIIVIGNLGRDPEMRYTPGGQGVTSFSIASSSRYTTSSGEQRGCSQRKEERPGSAPGRSLVRKLRTSTPSHPLQILQGLIHTGPDYPSPDLLIVIS